MFQAQPGAQEAGRHLLLLSAESGVLSQVTCTFTYGGSLAHSIPKVLVLSWLRRVKTEPSLPYPAEDLTGQTRGTEVACMAPMWRTEARGSGL